MGFNKLRGLMVAAVLAIGLTVSTTAHAFWCEKAEQFQGHCDICNAMCLLEHWVIGE